ncbi:MAG: DUF1302 family protein [Pseudomonadota bacterium]|nr:DUF1302 family protein [Pseudomonadota bacterium]
MAGLAVGLTAPAGAVTFKMMDGALDGSFDTTLSWGMSMRTERPNVEMANTTFPPGAEIFGGAGSLYGNRDFDDKWDIVINRFQASHDLDLSGNGWGVFLRGNYFWDEAADGQDLNDSAENKAVSGGSFTDAYIWWRMGADDQLMFRLGKQVISWGESTFILHNLNDVNTFDFNNLRQPGTELKNILIGTPGLSVAWQATDSISFDVFTLFAYDEIRVDHSGGVFLTLDAFGDDGAAFANGVIGPGITLQHALGPMAPAIPLTGQPSCTAPDGIGVGIAHMCQTGDGIPSGWGQWGIAMHYYAAGLGSGVDFGFYYQNLHDHVFKLGVEAGDLAVGGTTIGRYFRWFPENIERWGMSWNTTLGPWAWGGEYAYRRNQKLQGSVGTALARSLGLTSLGPSGVPLGVAPGTRLTDVEDYGHHQILMTFQRLWGPMPMFAGADQWNTIVEVAHGWVTGMPDKDTFARFDESITNNWQGLNFLSQWTYNNALFNRANLELRAAGKWDIRGQSPQFGGAKWWIEDRKQFTLGMSFDYRQRWKGGVSHTWFWGGGSRVYGDDQTGLNTVRSKDSSRDRDFLAFDLSYTF